ncbi:GNAT family N-acetyltransferase [Sporosarcina aquimarina]|uniref:GNAT family N-acetyltransferase n=1 Tax=Sporosarcina aquimarina TaxID=114975 RepID=UPI0020406132|nr:GNAT family N-acetyltransferase [Sporosarcina aquimarina]MCM3759018.1 GNAT family N-acetyltransferase [Sporosarcina aquimarina]
MNKNENILPHIRMRKLREDDYEIVKKWSRDDTFCEANGWDFNRSEKELYRWWLHCVTHESKDFVRLGIQLGDKLVGYVDLAHINNHTAEIGIAIGESDVWGKGIGSRSIIIMMEYASDQFGITIFDAETQEGNIRSRKMLEKVGFVEISKIGKEEYLGTDNQLIQFRFYK